jgi:hypothetical protein
MAVPGCATTAAIMPLAHLEFCIVLRAFIVEINSPQRVPHHWGFVPLLLITLLAWLLPASRSIIAHIITLVSCILLVGCGFFFLQRLSQQPPTSSLLSDCTIIGVCPITHFLMHIPLYTRYIRW